jgi:predicted dehydrogenase
LRDERPKTDPVRWGILGTAGIAASAFLPALREAGGGAAIAVAGRDRGRTETWAERNGVERALEGYAALLEQADIEAVYVPLPNALHAEWAIAALEAGKAVFCEKPLCATPEETEQVLEVARTAPKPLWEAFVFPFHPQIERVRTLLAEGAIGQPREIMSSFHFVLDDPQDIRFSSELAGGALQDVGCYPVRLARLLFGEEPILERTIADAAWAPSGVDAEVWGALSFSGDRRLVFSCGFQASFTAATVILGTEGEIRITNPFHPEQSDELIVVRDGKAQTEPAPGAMERSFTPAIRHIHRALRGAEPPRHLAIDEALGNATAVAALLEDARGRR